MALAGVMAVVVAHWAENIAQTTQIYVLGWPTHEAGGVLGLAFPWLVHSEWLHHGYALIMLAGLIVLRTGFVGGPEPGGTSHLASSSGITASTCSCSCRP